MKNILRILSAAMVVVFGMALLSACGTEAGEDTQKPTDTQPVITTASNETEPFVAPADSLGRVVSADAALITWNLYETSDETIDFMGINVKELNDPADEMTLFYLEEEVTYYKVSEGKLNPAAVEDAVAGSIIGVTTLEEGVQEVYIIFAPVEDDGSDEYNDITEEIIEDTVATTAAPTEEDTPDDNETVTVPSEEATEEPDVDTPAYQEPSLEDASQETEPSEE